MEATETGSAQGEEIATAVIDGAVKEQETQGKQSIDAFLSGVEHKVEDVTTTIASLGEENRWMITSTLNAFDTYATEKKEVLGSDHMVGNTAAKGAAAWVDKGNGNERVYDNASMSTTADMGYWGRVGKHEGIHQNDQAARYNLPAITYNNTTVSVHPVLTEWQACQANIASDLTPEYLQHVAEGDELVRYLGSAEPLLHALKTGDMISLQMLIEEREIEKIRGTLSVTR